MNLSSPFIHRPVMTTFIMLAILIGGWLSYLHLPVSDLPSIEKPRIHVTAGYRGASPEDVLYQLTIPLEKELMQVKGVQEMTSSSASSNSHISLDFALTKNMDEAIRDVQAALNRAEGSLPADIDPRPSYSRQESNGESIIHMLLMSEAGNIGELRNYADSYIIPKLSRIEGIAQVQVLGPSSSISLKLNPELMAARKIAFSQVIDAVKQHTAQVPLGSIQTSNKVFSIEIPNKVKQVKDLEMLYIGDSGIRLREIAEVEDKADGDQEFFLVTPDKRIKSIILSVQKVNDGNTVSIANEVETVVAMLQKELPASMELSIWFNKAVWIKESIHDVQWSLLFAFALVIAVIYLSLGRLSEALIPSAALPMSLVGTFIAMYLFDFSLDLLSLLALTLSVGFVVDDAIVVLENIVRHKELGKDRYEASLSGSKQICFTVLSMTISLVAVFIPLLFMEGMTGRLFREFSVTLAVSILVSGFISLSLTPMLCSKFLPKYSGEPTKVQLMVKRINSQLVEIYSQSLRNCLNHPKKILGIAFLGMAIVVPLFTKLSVQLVPPEDRGFVIAFVHLPTGTRSEDIKAYQLKLEGLVKDHPGIRDILDINYEGNVLLLATLKPAGKRASQEEIIADIQKKLNTVVGVQAFVQGYHLINLDLDITGGHYKYLVRGKEFDEVNAAAETLVAALQKKPEFVSVQTANKNDAPELAVDVNIEYAHQLGIEKRDIQSLLQNAYSKSSIGAIQYGTHEKKIYMELLPEYRSSAAALSKLYIETPAKGMVPLKAVASWHEKLGAPRLLQKDQLPTATVRFAMKEGVSSQEGLQIVEDTATKVLSSSVNGYFGASAKAAATTMYSTLWLLLAAAVVMYVVLGILYESFIHPLTILSSLPFAALGGVLTLFLFNEPISIFSAVGFLLLIGIVKKNGIMMVDYALEAQKRGLSPQEAIIEGCLIRFRPIMMTTVAAIMGAIPIAIGFGDGAEMRRGLGLVIVGGLLFAQVLTLYITPLLYQAFSWKK